MPRKSAGDSNGQVPHYTTREEVLAAGEKYLLVEAIQAIERRSAGLRIFGPGCGLRGESPSWLRWGIPLDSPATLSWAVPDDWAIEGILEVVTQTGKKQWFIGPRIDRPEQSIE